MSKLEELFEDFKSDIESMSEEELFDFFNKIDVHDNEPEIESYINDVLSTCKCDMTNKHHFIVDDPDIVFGALQQMKKNYQVKK